MQPTGSTPFLETDLPHWAARGLGNLLIGVFAAAFIASLIIRLPETVACPFLLVPVGGTDPVRASTDGTVLAIKVAEGQAVVAGQPLFVLRSDSVGDKASELAGLRVQQQGLHDSLAAARKRHEQQRQAEAEELRRLQARSEFLTRKIDSTRTSQGEQKKIHDYNVAVANTEVVSYTRELEVRKKVAALAEETSAISAKLAKVKALADLEFLRIRLEMDKTNLDREETERALSVAKVRLDQLKSTEVKQQAEFTQAMDQLETERHENESALAKHRLATQVQQSEAVDRERGLQESLDKATIRIAALQAELDRSKGNEVTVEAPCAGTVLRLRVKGTGSFVRTGEVLGELAPSGGQLQAELIVPPARVGRIQAEQRVKLLYDAYPYQRYGVQLGTVRWVSPASVQGTDGDVFRVLADNDAQTIRVSGQDRALLAGMGGRAEVVVGRRSLFSYALDPLRQLQENLSEPAAKPQQ